VRRAAPRHLGLALERLSQDAAPATVLARVQAIWPEVVGEAVAAEAMPTAERAGRLTVTCRSAGWAHELALAGPDFVQRLNKALEPSGSGPLRELAPRAGRAGEGAAGPAAPRFP
jgi:predicted nucleic acid-binding Zn ribbon protein